MRTRNATSDPDDDDPLAEFAASIPAFGDDPLLWHATSVTLPGGEPLSSAVTSVPLPPEASNANAGFPDPLSGAATRTPLSADGSGATPYASDPLSGAPTRTPRAPTDAYPSGRADPLSGFSTRPLPSPGPLHDGAPRPCPPTVNVPSNGSTGTIPRHDTFSGQATSVAASGSDLAASNAAPALSGGDHAANDRPTLGSYVLMERLGSGGMGVVYRAVHKHHQHREYAIKVIRPDVGSGPAYAHFKEQFVREGTILQDVRHPNVLRCYVTDEAMIKGHPALYMVLELLEGEALNVAIARGPLLLDRVLAITQGLARALQALHKREILHRDVKPANVWLSRDGQAKLIDFGLASVADWRIDYISQASWGSPPYMPPEQFTGLTNCTPPSDLYSLGCTVYEMVTGTPPFRPDTTSEYQRCHERQVPTPFAERFPEVETGPLQKNLWHVVSKLLAKDLGERYDSADDLLADLDRAAVGQDVESYRVTPGWVLAFRRRARRALAVVALLAVFAVVVFFLTRLDTRTTASNLVKEATQAFGRGDWAEVQRLIPQTTWPVDPTPVETELKRLQEAAEAEVMTQAVALAGVTDAERMADDALTAVAAARNEGRLGELSPLREAALDGSRAVYAPDNDEAFKGAASTLDELRERADGLTERWFAECPRAAEFETMHKDFRGALSRLHELSAPLSPISVMRRDRNALAKRSPPRCGQRSNRSPC